MTKLRLAVIGCGAQTELNHLPVLSDCQTVEVAALVDSVLPRAKNLARKYDVQSALDNYRDIVGKVDAAVVSLPNSLHAPVTIDLLQSGIHVLIEKPMAVTTAECDEMIKAASLNDMTLAVGLHCRFYDTFSFVKVALDSGLLGSIEYFDCRVGLVHQWPSVSDYLLRKENGGGLLVDVGVHVLDLLLWWLGDYEHLNYYDDSLGGVEANCELIMKLQSGASGVVELSRTRKLKNTLMIEGEVGILEVGFYNRGVEVRLKDQDLVLRGNVGNRQDLPAAAFRRQIDDFVDAISSRRPPFVSGQEGKRAVALIEASYNGRRRLEHPWTFAEATLA